MPTIATADLDVDYTDDGVGPAVILLHGWPDAPRAWLPIRVGLLDNRFRVIVPALRGFGATRFRDPHAVRDGSAAALAGDAVELAAALRLDTFAVIGHDWGGRTAYTLAAAIPERLTSITAIGVGYQPRGVFEMPDFEQARRFWYQWLMYVPAGADSIAADPAGYARMQWDTWSPPGWYDDAEFTATAEAFANPDWPAITLNAYRGRFASDESRDVRFDAIRRTVDATDRIEVPTLMIQGGADACDPPVLSEGLDDHFDDYRRLVIDGAGHFPHREAPQDVLSAVVQHLGRTGAAIR